MLPWTTELCIDKLGRSCWYEAGEGMRWLSDAALGRLAKEISRQSQMLAFSDLYTAIAYSFALLLPFVLYLKRVAHHRATPA